MTTDQQPDHSTATALSGLKVLLLSYYFPPLASAGGHRTGALARNLCELGASVTVITARHGLDVSDEDLVTALPAGVRVVRVPSLEGAKLRSKARDRFKHERLENERLEGDAEQGEHSNSPSISQRAVMAAAFTLTVGRSFIPWAFRKLVFAFNAQRACRREIRRARPDVLVASLGPMCQSWAAVRAARGTGVPVVFDFRDLWTPAPEYWKNFLEHRITRPVAWVDRPIERWTMRHTDLFVANHDQMLKTLAEFEPHTRGRTIVVPNGYEESDFRDLARGASSVGEPLRVRSMGTTYIGTVAPLLSAAELLAPAAAQNITIELIGPYYDSHAALDRADGIQVVNVRPPLPHSQALHEMAQADVLLFLLRDTPGIADMIPARLYEYLRLGKPILALAPDGAAKDLVLRHGGTVIHPHDVSGLRDELTAIAARTRLPGAANPADPEVRSFDRCAQALVFGRALQQLAVSGQK
ncbi:MAG: glycosyltransferase [Thermoleophilaceae bacterium]|nr:glycosyltransferase [Thermoleophilaceae bacterium]